MTVPVELWRNNYTGDGATDTYSYDFRINDSSNLAVFVMDTAGVQARLVLDVDYTVSGVGSGDGGDVVLTAGNLTLSHRISLVQWPTLTQEQMFNAGGPFRGSQHEDAVDKLQWQVHRLQDQLDRCIIGAGGLELPTREERAGRVLGFDEDGAPIAVDYVPSDPYLFYRFGDQTGTGPYVIPDSSGNGNDGSATAITVVTDGQIGRAYNEDGNGPIVTPYKHSGEAVSVSCFLRDVQGNGTYIFGDLAASEALSSARVILMSQTDKYSVAIGNDTIFWGYTESDSVVPSGAAWVHVCLVIDGDSVVLYVAGTPVITQTSSVPLTSSVAGSTVRVGGGGDITTSPCVCDIDQFRIFNRALTASEALALSREF